MTRTVLALSVALLALTAVPAGAATVELSGRTLRFTAAPGETNVVSVAADTPSGYFVVTDPGAPLTAGSGCSGPPGGPVICAADLTRGRVVLDLRDGDDRASAPLPATIDVIASGGPGDDEITGGDGDDVLRGGPGDDILEGDYGRDVADYSDHQAPVVVDVTSPAPAGQRHERDSLSGIEGVRGGAGDDRIRASGASSRCGAGEDRLTPVGDSGLRASGDCELLAFSGALAVARTATLHGRDLQLRVVSRGGASRAVRLRIGGRSFTRRVHTDYGGAGRLRLRLPAAVAARARIVRVAAQGRTVALRIRR
jgi:hypothetical protein